MRESIRYWHASLQSFTGFGGLPWFYSLFTGKSVAHSEEDLSPEAIASPGVQFASLAQGPVAYIARGDGTPPLIFLHCLGGSLESWSSVQAVLASRFRTVAFDFYGFGASARPALLSPQDLCRQLFDLMDALAIPAATLVGHSLGGRIALMCAAHNPERVNGLVLCAADWGQSRLGYQIARSLGAVIINRIRRNPAAMWNILQRAYQPGYPITEELFQRGYRPLCVRGSARSFQSLTDVPAATHRLDAILRAITCPALVLWGAGDTILPVEFAMPLARKLPHAELVVIPDAGHLPQEEYPETVMAHIARFVDAL